MLIRRDSWNSQIHLETILELLNLKIQSLIVMKFNFIQRKRKGQGIRLGARIRV